MACEDFLERINFSMVYNLYFHFFLSRLSDGPPLYTVTLYFAVLATQFDFYLLKVACISDLLSYINY